MAAKEAVTQNWKKPDEVGKYLVFGRFSIDIEIIPAHSFAKTETAEKAIGSTFK